MTREIKFKGKYQLLRNGETTWCVYGVGSKPSLVGAKWLIEDLQYTGLKDKNGKEIYEGDIVHQFGGYDMQVVFEECAFYFHYPTGSTIGRQVVGAFYPPSLQVIGNIFENPELLEVKK